MAAARGRRRPGAGDELAASDYYIADGHHRVSAALEEWRLAGKPADAGLLCHIHPMDGLQLSSFHRRVSGPLEAQGLLGLLSAEFDVHEVSRAALPAVGSIGLYVDRRWFELTYHGVRRPGVAGLDVTILQTLVLDRVAAVAARARPDDRYRPRHDVRRRAHPPLRRRRPRLVHVGAADLRRAHQVADGGEVMPPKTTYFEPKPCTGIFLRR